MRALEGSGAEYAVCGGLALAIHGVPRATVDIDVLVPAEGTEEVKRTAHRLGYDLEAEPMVFADGAVVIHRVWKVDPDSGDLLSLDLVVVTPALQDIWAGRCTALWSEGEITGVSREGLIAMKRLRGNGRDLDDIATLEADQDAD